MRFLSRARLSVGGPSASWDASVVVAAHGSSWVWAGTARPMASRIVVLGATGHTGRLVSEALVALGERPVLAGRSPTRLTELADRLGGLETRVADTSSPGTVFGVVGDGDVLVSLVGP